MMSNPESETILEEERPRCPRCEMRMIMVRHPPPAKHECLRCSYTEPVAVE
jgi:ribosomal protein S27AE